MFKKSIIAAAAALVISASMAASPAHALSKKGAFAIGAFSALAITAVAAANAQARGHGYGYGYEGHGGYSPRRSYKRAARRCADRYGWKTWRWERCMERRGF